MANFGIKNTFNPTLGGPRIAAGTAGKKEKMYEREI
jgi:hypothetical protein